MRFKNQTSRFDGHKIDHRKYRRNTIDTSKNTTTTTDDIDTQAYAQNNKIIISKTDRFSEVPSVLNVRQRERKTFYSIGFKHDLTAFRIDASRVCRLNTRDRTHSTYGKRRIYNIDGDNTSSPSAILVCTF